MTRLPSQRARFAVSCRSRIFRLTGPDLETLLDHARNVIDGPETEEMNTNDARFERHHHNSNKESIDLEPALEKGGAAADAPDAETGEPEADVEEARHKTRA